MFSVGKTAQITAEMTRYGIGILGISECRWSGFGRLKARTGGKRKRGRPRKTWRRTIERELKENGYRNMGSSSIGCRGQNSLEAESLQPNSPLGEWINDELSMKTFTRRSQSKFSNLRSSSIVESFHLCLLEALINSSLTRQTFMTLLQIFLSF